MDLVARATEQLKSSARFKELLQVPPSVTHTCTHKHAQTPTYRGTTHKLRGFIRSYYARAFKQVVLAVGNYLNAGTRAGGSYGFKIGTLLKLKGRGEVARGHVIHASAKGDRRRLAETQTPPPSLPHPLSICCCRHQEHGQQADAPDVHRRVGTSSPHGDVEPRIKA